MEDTGAQPEGPTRKPFLGLNETVARLGLAIFFLYLFLVGVKSLEKGISSFGGDFVDQVFSSVANPIAGLAAGGPGNCSGPIIFGHHRHHRRAGRGRGYFPSNRLYRW